MKHELSEQLYKQAVDLIPGGVNSPVRACRSVGCHPVFIDRAIGCYIFDVDGNRYIDYVGSWGPMILGHRPAPIIEAVGRVLERGTSFGAPTDLEIELAEILIAAIPSVDMVRMVNSGTEATMSAIRLARGCTGRDTIIKFDGCYHGHADTLLVAAGSGVATLAIPGSPGIPESVAGHTLSVPYNDLEAVWEIFNVRGSEIAGVIVEPVAGNMGLVPPAQGFLEGLRKITEQHGSLLIFDEVMTGFRVAYGGAQALYDVTPDLTTLGKIIGGGFPVGAYGGQRKIMEQIAPQGSIYQAGTLSGNPVAMAAGIATLKEIHHPGFYDALDQKAERLTGGLQGAANAAGIPVQISRVGSMVGMFFTDHEVTNFDGARTSDLQRFTDYYQGMLKRGIYLAPSQFEALFVSSAHNLEHIDDTITAAKGVMEEIS
ncbi:Glutamate-1-semialdehyde 2,1-aminomutase (EC [Olavius algarvensis associated proteobacterium Delta 3]|nr:Glutamate-1-semialdehyde 2,1-aminomutase (EC [Olavius algarvensis associated proteobacterium Delta 3]CAB5084579.1 Glutamate-1-semialdehyde 2,1-aminomutase (EC [Olavius algarvensis associated proteobacterium Delta 3]